mmetsp:Transcript_16633/g.24198  ORF Transcript_16633/g.24198 Transcript_16633/m.24198 type:complete len:206 (+) Transcript_16633:80-697(+)
MTLPRFLKIALLTAATFCYTSANEDSIKSAIAMVDFIIDHGSEVTVKNNLVNFKYDGVSMGLKYHTRTDRVQMVTQVAARVSDLEDGQLVRMLEANYHTMNDVRYAVDEGKVYAAFLYPLSDLDVEYFHDVLKQVVSAKKTFGTKYSAGSWVFSGHIEVEYSEPEIEDKDADKIIEDSEVNVQDYEDSEVYNFVQPVDEAEDFKD